MVVKDVLKGLHYKNQVSLRRKGKYGIEYVGGGLPSHVCYRYGYCEVVDACIDEQILVLYVY